MSQPGPPPAERIQLHLQLPYKHEVGEHHRVRNYLDRGYRIEQLQRVSDREALVTLVARPEAAGNGSETLDQP